MARDPERPGGAPTGHMENMRAWPKLRTTAALALAMSAEHADMHLLSSMYLALGRSLHIGPTELGELTMWRGIMQALPSLCLTQRASPGARAALSRPIRLSKSALLARRSPAGECHAYRPL